MPIFNNILAGSSGQATGYDIDQSLRFEDGDNAYLERSPTSNGNKKTFTLSLWTKRANLQSSGYMTLLVCGDTSTNDGLFWKDDTIYLYFATKTLETTQVFRDPNAWYHLLVSVDTTQSTETNRVKLYVNGEQVTDFSTTQYPVQDADTMFNNSSNAFRIGYHRSGAYPLDGYIAEVNFIDGQALTPASFGETNSDTNQWIPIEVTGMTYGTNGFYLPFSATELANSFTDSSEAGGRHNVSASGDAHTDTSVKKIGTASVQFDGTGDYLTVPHSSDWGFGTGDFTLEMWLRFANKKTGSGASGSNALLANHNSPNGWQWIYHGNDNTFDFWSTDQDEYNSSSSITINNDTWYHVAVTRDGNTLRHYLDGVQCGSNAFTETMSDTSTTLQIGAYDQSGLGLIDGYMDEIRISDICRYPDGTTFTPSTTAFTADSNTRLLLHCDGSNGGTSFPDSATRVITANGDVANARGTNLGTTYTHIDSFTSTGSSTWTCPSGVTSVEVLVVGGGGGGGNHYYGGGGGAGGVVHDATYAVTPGTVYDLSVGAGGGSQTNGTNSVFNINGEGTNTTVLTANGGGRGGEGAGGGAQQTGSAGGSGGGGAGYGSPNAGGSSNQTSPTGATGYGNAGGTSSGDPGAGGGGAGAAGSAGSSGSGGAGGAGRLFSTFTGYGASGYFGGGGGGAAHPTTGAVGGAGGQGGGGAGGKDGVNPVAGTANTGGGGGGTTYHDIPSGAAGGSGVILIAYEKSKPGSSSIKFDGTGDYLTSPDSPDWDVFGSSSDNWTIDFFVKHTDHAGGETYLSQSEDSSNYWQLAHYHSGGLWFGVKSGGSWIIDSTDGGYGPEITDTNWHHVALCKVGQEYGIYLDGAQGEYISDSSTDTFAALLAIGTSTWDGTNRDFDGYMDEIRIQNSNVFSASPNVGKTDTITVPTSAHTADSNTKLLIHSDFDGGLGADSSGNKNDFSATNLVATDQVLDSPTNNFCTLNSLNLVTNTTLSEGNLKADCTSSNDGAALGTMAVSSGKWYWEVLQTTANANNDISCGVMELSRKMAPQAVGGDVYPNSYLYGNDGWNAKHNSTTSTINTYGAGDIIGWALDLDGNTLKIYKNNSLEYTYSSGVSGTFTPLAAVDGTSGQSVTHIANFGQDSSFNGEKTAQGNGGDGEDFYYTPPTGFKALNTDNLSDPSIADPTKHFNTVLYTGNGTAIGSGGLTVTGVGFQPDFTWVKQRNTTRSHNLYNSVLGATKRLESSNTDAEATDTESLSSWNSDGFVVGNRNSVNGSSDTYVSWNWKAGGTASSNSDGSITSSVSANTTAGFSIVNWNGTEASATVGHGLSQAPELIIVKDVDSARGWPSNIENITGTSNQYLLLNARDQAAASSAYWGGTPGASVFTVGDSANTNDDASMIAYCFHSVEGYSKVGSYTGNSSADGAFLYTGFRPAWVMIKCYSGNDNQEWVMFDNKRDSYNLATRFFYADGADAETISSPRQLDFVSNGIKMRGDDGATNNSSRSYIYLAFAESPFKTSNAR